MLTVDQARAIANQWRPQFVDDASFEQSWSRFFELVGDPTREKLHNWLAKDQAKDAVKHAGIIREPAVPQRQRFAVDEPDSCPVCLGKRYVRRDVEIDHPHFGKALRCPACNHG
jgi:hypothetical protein